VILFPACKWISHLNSPLKMASLIDMYDSL
jgi:hypothetical protein